MSNEFPVTEPSFSRITLTSTFATFWRKSFDQEVYHFKVSVLGSDLSPQALSSVCRSLYDDGRLDCDYKTCEEIALELLNAATNVSMLTDKHLTVEVHTPDGGCRVSSIPTHGRNVTPCHL